MIRKKYFVLTAILLVGVVLLSGCMGGNDLLGGDDEIEEVIENTEAEVTMQSAVDEINNKNYVNTKEFFTNDFSYEESYSTLSLDDLLNMLISDTVNSVNISDFSSIEKNEYKLILKIDRSPNPVRYMKSVVTFENLENKNYISYMKDIEPKEEIELLNKMAKTIESNSGGKEEFIKYFSDSPELYFEDDPVDTPSDLYDILVQNDTAVMKNSTVSIKEYYYPGSNIVEIKGLFSITVEGRNDNPQTLDFIATVNTNTLKITKLK